MTAVALEAVETDFALDVLIAYHLETSDETDLHILAQTIADEVPEDHVREVLAESLRHRVREQIRQTRNRPPNTTSAKWEAVTRNRDIFRDLVWVGREYRHLGDCSADDLRYVAADYRRREAENAGQAKRFEELVQYLARRRVGVVAELSREKVTEILHD